MSLKDRSSNGIVKMKQVVSWRKFPASGLTASAVVASVGDGKTFKTFKNGRQLAAWLGLVPRQHSTGGKSTFLGISKRGDTYLRTLLIHGVRSVVRVAQANKNARIAWALLAKDRKFRSGYVAAGAGA